MILTNFSAGELGRQLSGRTDIPQYYSGAGWLVNFDVIPTGGIERRKGTERIARLSGDCRLIPFILDEDTSFILEVRPNEILLWKNGRRMMSGDTVQVSVSAPWIALSEIREIQYAQNYNRMVFVQQNHAPYMLTYNLGTDTFSGGTMSFDFSPDIELDDDYDWITICDDALPSSKTESGYCIFHGYLWKFNDDTGEWEKDSDTAEYEIDTGLFTTPGKYPSACAFFNGRLCFAATMTARQKVWASASPDISGERYNDFSTYVKYVTVNRVVTDPDIHFFTADTDKQTTEATSGGKTVSTTTGSATLLVNVTQDLTGIENLGDYYVTGENIPVGTKAVSATWDASTSRGTLTISSAVTAEGKALVFSVQKWVDRSSPSSGDYEYKVVNSNMTRADNAFFFEVASDQNDAIKWLATSSYLVIGTESGTYVMSAASSATLQQVVMNGRNGTDALQATVIDRAVIFLSQGLRGIREYYWNNTEEAFRSNNIAQLSPQMLSESPAVDFDFMTNPYARIIVAREDGMLSVLLYEKNLGVLAWSRIHLASGAVRSVAVTRGEGGSDLAYLVVEDAAGNYFMERIDMDKAVYLDGWSEFAGSTDGYGGTAVIVNADTGGFITAEDWDGGNYPVDFIQDGDRSYIGYAYESRIRSMPVTSDAGASRKRIVKLLVRFLESYRPLLESDWAGLEPFTDFEEPFSGVKPVDYPGVTDRDVTFTLSIDDPHPCTILAITALTD